MSPDRQNVAITLGLSLQTKPQIESRMAEESDAEDREKEMLTHLSHK